MKDISKRVYFLFHVWICTKVYRYIGYIMGQFGGGSGTLKGQSWAVKLTNLLFDTFTMG